jgi:hypothetical protein
MKRRANPAPFDPSKLGGDSVNARVARRFGVVLRGAAFSPENATCGRLHMAQHFLAANSAAVISGMFPELEETPDGYIARLHGGPSILFEHDFSRGLGWRELESGLIGFGVESLIALLSPSGAPSPFYLAQLLGVAFGRAALDFE